MNDINVVVLVGRLTIDPVVKDFTNSVKCTFSIAVGKRVRNGDQWQDQTSCFNIEAWNIGNLANFLKKDRRVIVEGQLDTSTWEESGVKRSRVYVRAKRITLADSVIGNAPTASQQRKVDTEASTQSESVYDEDIPF